MISVFKIQTKNTSAFLQMIRFVEQVRVQRIDTVQMKKNHSVLNWVRSSVKMDTSVRVDQRVQATPAARFQTQINNVELCAVQNLGNASIKVKHAFLRTQNTLEMANGVILG
jgi:hypothetical protein